MQACSAIQLLKFVLKLLEKDTPVADEVQAIFAGELNPVAPKAQKKVPVPEGYVPLSDRGSEVSPEKRERESKRSL